MVSFCSLSVGGRVLIVVVIGIWLRHCLNGDQDQFDLDWPKIWHLPVIRRKRGADGAAAVVVGKKKA